MNALKISIFFILLVVAVFKAHGRRNFEVYLDTCNCTSNPVYAEPCVCYVDKTFDPPRCFFDAQLHHEIIDARFSFEVSVLRNDNVYVLVNSTDNELCAFFNTKPKSQLNLLTIFRELLLKAGKLPEKCPFDKDYHFSFKEIAVDTELFPPYVPETKFYLNANFIDGNNFLMLLQVNGNVTQKTKKRWG